MDLSKVENINFIVVLKSFEGCPRRVPVNAPTPERAALIALHKYKKIDRFAKLIQVEFA